MIMSWLKRVLGGAVTGNTGSVADIIDKGTKLIDEAFTSQEEKLIAKQQLFDTIVQDKHSAREMYKADSQLQKIFALVFLVAYMSISGTMFYVIFWTSKDQIALSDFGITTISTLFGAMSAKINTITDFLFGSSVSDSASKKSQK